jgi:hypothetical protein
MGGGRKEEEGEGKGDALGGESIVRERCGCDCADVGGERDVVVIVGCEEGNGGGEGDSVRT